MKSYNKVLAIDFETANSNNNTACSIGFALLDKGEISLNKEILINPESHFSDKNIEIHKITPDMVLDKDIFPVVWKEVAKLIDSNTLVIAHNTAADITILSKLAAKYSLDITNFSYVCTMEAYKRNGKGSKYGLKSIANDLGINFKHHNSKEDALVCLKIFMNLLEDNQIITKKYIEKKLNLSIKKFNIRNEDMQFKRKFFKQNSFKASDIITTKTEFDENNPVYNKIFVVTGDLINIDKRDAAQEIVDLGGIYKDGFVKGTDYLIVGLNEYKEPSINTSKYKKAMEKLDNSGNIIIINEEEFLSLINFNVIDSKDENITRANPKEEKEVDTLEQYQQISLDVFMNTKEEKNNNIITQEKEKYIKPKKEWIEFKSIEEKLKKLKEYKLITAKATAVNKKIFYKGLYTDRAVECSILGYLDTDVFVISIEDELHSIRGEYLKQMQDSKFNRFEAMDLE